MLQSYPFYIDDWFTSETRMSFTAEQRGIYRDLLDVCWKEGSLPTNQRVLQAIASVTEIEWKRSWPEIADHFVERDGRLHHAKVDAKRPSIITCKENRAKGARSATLQRIEQRNGHRNVDRDDDRDVDPDPPPSPSPSPSPSLKENQARARVLANNTPQGQNGKEPGMWLHWYDDELYAQLAQIYRDNGKNVMDDDFAKAWRPTWLALDGEQKQRCVENLRARFAAEEDPRFVPGVKRWVDGEWRRPVMKPARKVSASDARLEQLRSAEARMRAAYAKKAGAQ